MDHHPALQRDKATDPAPTAAPAPAPPDQNNARETRRQRRQRLFASRKTAQSGNGEIAGEQPAAFILEQPI
jgi:hypothetical protein